MYKSLKKLDGINVFIIIWIILLLYIVWVMANKDFDDSKMKSYIDTKQWTKAYELANDDSRSYSPSIVKYVTFEYNVYIGDKLWVEGKKELARQHYIKAIKSYYYDTKFEVLKNSVRILERCIDEDFVEYNNPNFLF